MARTKTRNTSRSINFEGVETGGGAVHIPEGEYGMKCIEAEWDQSKEGNDMIAWIFQGTTGKAKGKKFYFYTSLSANSLWKLKETLEALGVEVPDGELDIDVTELVDLEATAVVEDDEYQGKTRSKITRFLAEEAGDSSDDEDEAPKKKVNGRSKKKVVKTSADEVNEMDGEELESLVDKSSLELDLGDYKTLSKKRAAVIASLEENDLLAE